MSETLLSLLLTVGLVALLALTDLLATYVEQRRLGPQQ